MTSASALYLRFPNSKKAQHNQTLILSTPVFGDSLRATYSHYPINVNTPIQTTTNAHKMPCCLIYQCIGYGRPSDFPRSTSTSSRVASDPLNHDQFSFDSFSRSWPNGIAPLSPSMARLLHRQSLPGSANHHSSRVVPPATYPLSAAEYSRLSCSPNEPALPWPVRPPSILPENLGPSPIGPDPTMGPTPGLDSYLQGLKRTPSNLTRLITTSSTIPLREPIPFPYL